MKKVLVVLAIAILVGSGLEVKAMKGLRKPAPTTSAAQVSKVYQGGEVATELQTKTTAQQQLEKAKPSVTETEIQSSIVAIAKSKNREDALSYLQDLIKYLDQEDEKLRGAL